MEFRRYHSVRTFDHQRSWIILWVLRFFRHNWNFIHKYKQECQVFFNNCKRVVFAIQDSWNKLLCLVTLASVGGYVWRFSVLQWQMRSVGLDHGSETLQLGIMLPSPRSDGCWARGRDSLPSEGQRHAWLWIWRTTAATVWVYVLAPPLMTWPQGCVCAYVCDVLLPYRRTRTVGEMMVKIWILQDCSKIHDSIGSDRPFGALPDQCVGMCAWW